MTFLDVPGVKAGALDASIQAKIEDTGSATRGALNATYVPLTTGVTASIDAQGGVHLYMNGVEL